jgi:hypothetical protein
MIRIVAAAAIVAACASLSFGLINPNFTPRHLVEQADVVFTGPMVATAKPLEWKLTNAKRIKGEAAGEHVISLARCDKDHVDRLRRAIQANGASPVILFSSSRSRRGAAYLHVAGMWLSAKAVAGSRWDITGPAPRMPATYAGGTDMLIRMSQHLLADPRAHVPVRAGVRWLERAKVGTVRGDVTGMAAVDVGETGNVHLFVASTAGDRLYRPKEQDGEMTFEDVTAKARLDTRSRRFAWLDVNADGRADLASRSGTGLSVRFAGKEGRFRPGGEGWSFESQTECIGLAVCSRGERPGVLVSTYGRPIHLAAGPTGWKEVAMPRAPGASGGRGEPSACVVADLDNDGFADVLQPAERGGLLWRGSAQGFRRPVAAGVAVGRGGTIPAIGDFDATGTLDVLLAGAKENTLWVHAGKGTFQEVLRYGGSLSYKCPPGASDVKGMDLNHDGWLDLCLVYKTADLLYHFNRGFRSFGEEGEVRLDGLAAVPGQPRTGQKALAVADFNKDDSQDLAVACTDGTIYCYFNNLSDMPGVRLRLGKGLAGPVTVTCRMGPEGSAVVTAASVVGPSPATFLGARGPGKVTITYRLPGKGEQTRSVVLVRAVRDVVLTGAVGK